VRRGGAGNAFQPPRLVKRKPGLRGGRPYIFCKFFLDFRKKNFVRVWAVRNRKSVIGRPPAPPRDPAEAAPSSLTSPTSCENFCGLAVGRLTAGRASVRWVSRLQMGAGPPGSPAQVEARPRELALASGFFAPHGVPSQSERNVLFSAGRWVRPGRDPKPPRGRRNAHCNRSQVSGLPVKHRRRPSMGWQLLLPPRIKRRPATAPCPAHAPLSRISRLGE